jgi:hypothetical protein
MNNPKLCFRCVVMKPRDDYSWRNDLGIWRNTCKACRNKYFPEESKYDRDKDFYETGKVLSSNAIWENNYLINKYGITLEKKNEMIEDQHGKCAICNNEFDNTAYIDHCHKTDKIRGILCNKCNSGLGMFDDDVEVLGNAISYLVSMR